MEDRRRAVEAKLVEKSKSNPGYYKYQIKIRELDGSEHIVPSYGVDMMDAIKRIIKNEKKEKFNKLYSRKIEARLFTFIFFSWFACIAISVFNKDKPEYALYGTISIMSFVLIYSFFNFLKKMDKY